MDINDIVDIVAKELRDINVTPQNVVQLARRLEDLAIEANGGHLQDCGCSDCPCRQAGREEVR